jgi:hypothetical protein
MKRLTSVALSGLLILSGLVAVTPSASADISTNGLVLHLDAGDSASYPGSGTTWTDTSGNGLNGTLVNGPTYSANNGGFIGLDGSNDYVSFGNISTNFSAGFSATFFANFGATTQGWERVFDFGTGTGLNNILAARSGTTDAFAFELYNGSGGSFGQCTAASTVSNNTWAHYAVTIDGANCKIYKNGVLVATNAYTALPTNVTRTSNFIGRSNWSGDGYFDSGIGEISIYNRAVSASEVWQNFRAESNFCSFVISSSGSTQYARVTTANQCLFSFPAGVSSYDYFIVGGGGGGGGANHTGSLGAGGGGGGGQVTSATGASISTNGTLTLTVGSGGGGGATNATGGTGGTSSIITPSGATLTALGGTGGQGSPNINDQNNLSGDGGAAGGGNAGGLNVWDGGGGGGGAGGTGTAGTDIGGQGGSGGAGGIGVQNSSITNVVTFFAAGGGGGGTPSNNVAPASQTDGFGAAGGSSVGGNGGVDQATKASGGVATAGVANTGSGGGGGGWNSNYTTTQKRGGDGASGVIYLKFTKSAGTISSISITSTAGADSVYSFGETLTVTINWSEIVTVAGTPRIPIQGLTSKFLTYSSGSDSTSTTFIYVPGSSDYDADGVAINANTLENNGGSFKDVTGLLFTITHLAISASSASVVDGRLIGSVNSITFSTTPTFRSPVTITVSVSVAGTVLFRAKGVKISNCVKRSTSGTSPTITATCVWRPSTRGATPVTATITPTNGSYSVGSLTNTVFISNRSGGR